MRKILLDTSVIIDFLRRTDKKQSLLYQFSEEELYVSIVTHTEIYAGKSVWEKVKAKQELRDLFSGIKILNLNEEISESAGEIKAGNTSPNLLDCIIAATAINHNLELATLNLKDFQKIKNIKIVNLG